MTARLLAAVSGAILALAAAAICAGAAPAAPLLEMKLEGKTLKAGEKTLLVAGYSLGGCYWEEQEFKVVTNGARSDRLVREGEAGQVEGCSGGAKTVELTTARKMTVKLAPLRIDLEGPCVYEFKEVAANFLQTPVGPEIYGNATGKLRPTESRKTPACAKTRTTFYDMALGGMETAIRG